MDTAAFANPSLVYTLTPMIWIGVLVLCSLNLFWGFALSGVIVPGFLVPLAIVYPLTALLVVLEAVLTYLIIAGICKLIPHYALGSKFFGRDRFFAIVLCSILVRIFVEGFILPSVSAELGSSAWTLDLQNSSTAFGLILVPLLANQFWKPGLIRGLAAALITCSLTYLIIRYLFVPLSGFSLANLAVQLDLASQYLPDSPKAYIVLLSTIFIASRFNLLYGWDFAGLMFPGLIALSLFDPLRVLMTIAETLFIVWIARLLLRSPALRSKALSGAYSLIFFFTISFLYKLSLGSFLTRLMPGSQIDDFLGLGYVMSTIFAIKICRLREKGPLLLSGIGQVAVIGCMFGLGAAYLLQSLHLQERQALAAQDKAQFLDQKEEAQNYDTPLSVHYHKVLGQYLRAEASGENGLFAEAGSNAYESMQGVELSALSHEVIKPLLRLAMMSFDNQDLMSDLKVIDQKARRHAFRLEVFPDLLSGKTRILLREDGQSSHPGLLFVTVGAKHHVALVVPRPLQDKGVLEFALWTYESQDLSLMLSPAAHPEANLDGSAVLSDPANRENFVHATLAAIAELRVVSDLAILEVASDSESARTGSSDLHLNPYFSEEKDRALANLSSALSPYGFKFSFAPDAIPSYSFETTLKAGGILLRSLRLPHWVLQRMKPLSGQSIWEERWQLTGRRKLFAADGQLQFASMPTLPVSMRAEIQDKVRLYLEENNPLRLLEAEAIDSSLHFDLLEDSENQHLVLTNERGQWISVLQLTGFPSHRASASALGPQRERGRL